jgi:glycosyltransferase involved in cell wall biosynthesis
VTIRIDAWIRQGWGSRRLRVRADRVRDARNWVAAAAAYGLYLDRRPNDGPIWVQRGNCLKEAGQYDAALQAYLRAEALRPRDSDVQLQLGHLSKLRGDPGGALGHYRRALAFDAANDDARREADALAGAPPAADPAVMARPAAKATDLWAETGADLDAEFERLAIDDDALAQAAAAPRLPPQYYIARLADDPHDRDAWSGLTQRLTGSPALDGDPALHRAIAETPDNAELLFQLARVLLRAGQPACARQALHRAYDIEPRLGIAHELRRAGATLDRPEDSPPPRAETPSIFLDITDLLHVLGERATVTGIQRVQCNLVEHVLAMAPSARPPSFVLWHDQRLWRLAPEDIVAALAHTDPYDLDGRRRLLQRAKDRSLRLSPSAGDAVVSTGVTYLTPDISACGQALKQVGVRLGAILYDFIPLTHPELVHPANTLEFGAAISDMVVQLDFAVTISEFTRAEAIRLMEAGGYAPIPMRAVPLAHSLTAPPADGFEAKARWGGRIAHLKGRPFVLCVGTFSAHKNQALLYEVWRQLAERGVEPPLLVLVGHRAFGVEDLFRSLETTRHLGGRVRVLEGLDDAQMATLYDACLFTIFPSKVEGWGLPVGESLAHGKVCVASDAASIPEVGGPLVIYIDPHNPRGAADVIGELLRDPDRRIFLESRIKAHFKARSWTDHARDLVSALTDLTATKANGHAFGTEPVALPAGATLKIGQPTLTWEHGDALPPRADQAMAVLGRLLLGEGWRPREHWGVWMDGSRARLSFVADAAPGAPITVALQLRAAQWARGNQVVVRAACGAVTTVGLPPIWSQEHQRSTPRNLVVLLDCVAGRGGKVELTVDVLGPPAPTWWGEPRPLVLGLVRLMFVKPDPAAAGLEPNQPLTPGVFAGSAPPRLTVLSLRAVEAALRRRLVLAGGWRQDDDGAWLNAPTARLAFVAAAAPGTAVRLVVSTRRRGDGNLSVDIAAPGGEPSRFELTSGEDRADLWVDAVVPADRRLEIDIGAAPAGGGQPAGVELAVTSVLYGLRKSAADRLELMEAVFYPPPSLAGPALIEAQRQSMGFVVAGHIKGSYSLALINRRLALALDEQNPGSVRIEQVEGHRHKDLADTPADETERLSALAARPPHAEGPVVAISQHWPVWSRPEESDLNLAFLHWEEGLVPRAMVTQLNNDFDGVLAPTRSVAKSLVDSGVVRPIAVVSDGPDVGVLLEAGARRLASRPAAQPSPERRFTFLHVSSCFPRKGVDVLLRAYAAAFTRDDPVRLVIKGFPNPHNDVEAQIAALRAANPAAPQIGFINEDLPREDIDDLLLAADAVVLPTRGEGFNLPALEALAAGAPVIATGFGGHMDFLDDDVARVIDFSFAQSQSHVASPGSTWVEPDADDLAKAMREAFDRAVRGERPPEDRARRGWERARQVGDAADWAQRVREASLSILRTPANLTPKVAWVSTWNVRCGIAEYSAMLLAHYPEARANVTVLCDGRTAREGLGDAHGPPAHVAWELSQPPSMERLAQEIDAIGADTVVIQHQPGLIAWPDLINLLRHPRLARRRVVVELHTVYELPGLGTAEAADIVSALRIADRVLVHTVRDLNTMKAYGLVDNVTLFPHGVSQPGDAPQAARHAGSAPLIGSYGFFLPGKGLDELIRALAIVRHRRPGARLRLVNAEFPDRVSQEEIARCRKLAARLNLVDAIEWRTEFLANDESHRLLHDCDLVVLAHQGTRESASGAVRVALASGAPVAVTPIPIFDDTRPATAPLPGTDAASIAAGIEALLADRDERARLQERARTWTAAYAWQGLAERLAGMLAGLAAAAAMPAAPLTPAAEHSATTAPEADIAPDSRGERPTGKSPRPAIPAADIAGGVFLA